LGQNESRSIERIEAQSHLLEEGFVAVVVDVGVYESTQGCLPPKRMAEENRQQ
jgi:hypothetical protein